MAVPKRSLVAEAGANFVFVAEADSVRKVEVDTGYADDEFIEIVRGVESGDRVVIVGQGGLRHGSRVRDLNAPEEEEAEADPEAAIAEDERVASLGG